MRGPIKRLGVGRSPARRPAYPWTPTGLGVLATAASSYLLGARLSYPELRGVAAGLTALVLLATVLVLRRPRLTVGREAEPARLTVGMAAVAHLTATNRSLLPTQSLVFVDRLGAATIRTTTAPIAAHGRRDLYYLVEAPRRGRLTLGPVTVERRDPLGLARRAQSFPTTARELWVRPRVHPMVALPVLTALDEEQQAAVLPRGSRAASSPRTYVPGDDPRHVHWRLTARTGTLTVREREEAKQPGVTVLLDTRATSWDEERFDQAVEVAASLVAAATTGLGPAELTILGESGLDPDVTSPMDRLAAAQLSASVGVEALVLAAEQANGGALVLVTGHAVGHGVVSRFAGLRRQPSLVVVIQITAGQTTVVRPTTGLVVLSVPSAKNAVAAWNAMPGWGGAAG